MKRIVLPVLLAGFVLNSYAQNNVGIGTNNPGSKLQVSGSLAAAYANQTQTPYSLGAGDYYDAWSGTSNGTFNLPAAVNGAGNFVGRVYILKNATSSYLLTVQANGSELIDGASSVTVQPGNSVTLISNGATGAVTTWNVVSSTPSSGSATGWSTAGNAGTTPSSSPIGTAANNNFAGTTDAKDFVVATNGLERMRATSSGNLGIGTTAPEWPFVLRNTSTATNSIMSSLANAGGSMDANFELVTARGVTTDNNSGDVTTQLGLNYAGGTTLNAMIRFHRGGSTTGGFMSFTTNNNTEAMRIDASQHVGIGTTSPVTQLHTTGTVRFANYPSGMISTDASGDLQTVSITGSSDQIDISNGNGAANPNVGIDPAYTAQLKAQNIMTGGGTVTYSGGNLSWSARFIVINNGTGSQFSTNGYFDIIQPPSGTVITGVGSAASVTATASGVPLGCWDALYYILPVGSSNGVIYSNFRIAQYGAGFLVPENWILIANENCDDGSVRLGTGVTLTPGQSSNNGSGAYIDNGTAQQSANFNISGNGTIGGTLQVGTYGSVSSTPTSYGSIALTNGENGYYGLLIGTGTAYPNYMYSSGGYGGIYFQNTGIWEQYYLPSTNHLNIGTSTDLGATLGVNGTGYYAGTLNVGSGAAIQSYGNIALNSGLNGWNGMLFGPSTAWPCDMYESGGIGGLYYQNYGWETLYWPGDHDMNFNYGGDLGYTVGVGGSIGATSTIRGGGYQDWSTGYQVIDAGGGWHRSYGASGWYNGSYGGGWYMADGSWIRTYGGQGILSACTNATDALECTTSQNYYPVVAYAYGSNSSYGAGYFYGYVVAANYYGLSTRELKTDIVKFDESDYQSALSFMDDLNLNYYKFKADSLGATKVGFIAEETPGNLTAPGKKAVSYSELSIYNTGAIKVLKKKIESLENQLKNISDFGAENVVADKFFIPFSESFKSQLGGAKPVVTVTPSQLGAQLVVSEITQDGFTVQAGSHDAGLNLNWIAMAKVAGNPESAATPKYNERFSKMLDIAENNAKTHPVTKLAPKPGIVEPAIKPEDPVKAPAAVEPTGPKLVPGISAGPNKLPAPGIIMPGGGDDKK